MLLAERGPLRVRRSEKLAPVQWSGAGWREKLAFARVQLVGRPGRCRFHYPASAAAHAGLITAASIPRLHGRKLGAGSVAWLIGIEVAVETATSVATAAKTTPLRTTGV